MTDKWQPGTTYAPGALVAPLTASPLVIASPINPSFETGNLTGWTDATGTRWSVISGAYSGAYSAKLSGSGHAELLNNARITVTPGLSITVSSMIKLTNNGTNDQYSQVVLAWFDASGTEITVRRNVGALVQGQGGVYKQSTASGIAPAGAATASVILSGDTGTHGGTQTFDGVVWSYAYQSPSVSMIFKAVQAAPGKSATTEPTWPTVNGVQVVDNQVTWEAVTMVRVIWKASPILLSGGTEPAWPTVIGGFVHDGTINWEAIDRRVADPKCPQSKVVAIMASKVFAADRDIVRFSATANPLDWSAAQDAGYLPTGLQQANSNDMAVLAPYRSNLTAFNASTFQNWQVDPDPAAMALLDQMEGIGSQKQHAAQPVGNELFYLSQLGVRSVSVAAGSDNLASGDIGMPIDVLVQDAIRVSVANDTKVLSTYYPSSGQYWLAVSNYPPDALAISGRLPDGYAGQVVSFQYVASGGVSHYGDYTITSGMLPDGLSMNAQGLVTGTRTTVETSSWVVSVVDARGTTATLPDTSNTITNPIPAAIYAKLSAYWDMTEVSGTRIDSVIPPTGHGNDFDTNTNVTAAVGLRGGSDISGAVAGNGGFQNNTSAGQPQSASVQVPVNGSFCVFGWFYLNSIPVGSGESEIVAKWGNGGYSFLEYLITPYGGQLRASQGGDSGYVDAFTTLPSLNAWHFVASWRDVTDGKVRIQLDNGVVGVSDGPSNPTPRSSLLQLGTAQGVSFMNGRLSRWGFIKGDLLTQDEMTWMINSGQGRDYAEIKALAGH